MAYLSRIWLNPLRTATQRMLRDPHVMHAAVLGGIPAQPVTERVLWRIEAGDPYRAELLVLTRSVPSWEHLVEQGGWPGAEEPQALVRDYTPLLERLGRGGEFAFRLRANPVTATRIPLRPSPAQERQLERERPRGVRVPHRTAAHQLAWLTERLGTWGFEAVDTADGNADVLLAARERVSFTKGRKERHRVVLSTATFTGRLRVTSPDQARRALLDGVGPARAYGCGLITLAPAVPTATAGGASASRPAAGA